jgi:hypothetical protein
MSPLLNGIFLLGIFYLTIVAIIYILKMENNSFTLALLIIVVCLVSMSIQGAVIGNGMKNVYQMMN